MDTLDSIKILWQQNKDSETANYHTLNQEEMKKIINPKIKKEQRTIKEYLLGVIFWQIVVYSVLCHYIVRYWGDTQFVLSCIMGILIFVLYTVIFHKNIKRLKFRSLSRQDAPLNEICDDIKTQVHYVSQYFNYKKWLDLVGIPVICFVITLILLKASPIPDTLTARLVTFGLVFVLFVYGTYNENKKSFIRPLNNLRLILKDIESVEGE
jgi:hypothetical protein